MVGSAQRSSGDESCGKRWAAPLSKRGSSCDVRGLAGHVRPAGTTRGRPTAASDRQPARAVAARRPSWETGSRCEFAPWGLDLDRRGRAYCAPGRACRQASGSADSRFASTPATARASSTSINGARPTQPRQSPSVKRNLPRLLHPLFAFAAIRLGCDEVFRAAVEARLVGTTILRTGSRRTDRLLRRRLPSPRPLRCRRLWRRRLGRRRGLR